MLFLVTAIQAGKRRPVAHAVLRIAGHQVTADAAGRALIVLQPRGRASGSWRAVATAPGYRPGQVDLHPVARRRHRAIAG